MREEREYPISETKFKELIEPIIKKEQKKLGRTIKISHSEVGYQRVGQKRQQAKDKILLKN